MLMTAPELGLEAVKPEEKVFYKALGARIAELRKERDLTQQLLADELGISQKTVAHYEVGRFRLQVSTLLEIADLLGVSVPTLLGPLVKPSGKRKPGHKHSGG